MNRKRTTLGSFILLSLVASFFIYYSGRMFCSCLGSALSNFGRLYPVILVAPLMTAVFYFGYQHLFTKRFSKKGLIIASTILAVLGYSGIFVTLLYKDFYYRNPSSLFYTVITLIFLILLILSATTLVVLSLMKVLTFEKKEPLLSGIFKPVTKVYQKIIMVLFMIFSFYFVFDGLTNLFAFTAYSSFFYVIALIGLLLAYVDFFFFYANQKNDLSKIILPIFNGAIAIGFIVFLYCDCAAFIEVTDSLFLIEYLTSKPVGLVIYLIISLGSSIYDIYTVLKKPANKASVTERN
ncbi:MAG: hypothetical protein WCR56_00790 [Bacilli bacterium]